MWVVERGLHRCAGPPRASNYASTLSHASPHTSAPCTHPRNQLHTILTCPPGAPTAPCPASNPSHRSAPHLEPAHLHTPLPPLPTAGPAPPWITQILADPAGERYEAALSALGLTTPEPVVHKMSSITFKFGPAEFSCLRLGQLLFADRVAMYVTRVDKPSLCRCGERGGEGRHTPSRQAQSAHSLRTYLPNLAAWASCPCTSSAGVERL